jgi:hypothetical protein
LEENNCGTIMQHYKLCGESIQMYIKLFLILYADTALMAESPDGLQKTLNCFEKYCDLWKLTVNKKKTKVVIFSKKKVRQNQSFKIRGQHIEIIDSYCYIGLPFNYNGNFCTARKQNNRTRS